jgi:23S rRNA (uridine2552-2'-O)-methyltransferase
MSSFRFLTRSFSSSTGCLKSKSSGSTNSWLKRHVKDPYVLKSTQEDFRARSAYKLLEINAKTKMLKPGQTIVECGAAPGAWTQVATQIVGQTGTVVACDLLDFEPVDGAIILPERDFTHKSTQEEMKSLLDGKPIDVVLSDMAPNVSGNSEMDHDAITALVYSVLKFAILNAESKSSILVKMFNGSNQDKLLKDFELCYNKVKIYKPPSSRNESSELFIVGQNLKEIKKKN